MMALVLTGVLAADPLTNVEEHAQVGLGVHAALALASGMAPGANVGVTTGMRVRVARVSWGFEAAFFLPGQEEVRVPSTYGCWPRCVERISSMAITATVPVCFHVAWFSACGVATGGAAGGRDTAWQPIVSAGGRVAIDPHFADTVAAYLALQVLGGIVRADFEPWRAAPLQVGLTLGGMYELL